MKPLSQAAKIKAMTINRPRQLTDAFIRALPAAAAGKRYAISDSLVPGLRVRVTDTGTKTFILWRRTDPRAQSASALALGAVGELTLADARAKARTWLAQIAEGTDPRAAAKAERASTFSIAAELFLQRHVAGQRRAKAVEREIRNELISRWGNRPLAKITRRDVIQMVDELVARGVRSQARNLLTNCKTLFSWAVEHGLLENSPADHVSSTRLIGEKRVRTRVLDDDEIRSLWAASEDLGYPHAPVVRMLMLTGCRCNEIAQASWSEIDLAAKVLVIPAKRFKSGSNHIVPLSDPVLELLATLPRWTSGDFLFSYNGGRSPIKNFGTLKRKLDATMGDIEPWVLHDLRRSCRTRLSELRVPENVAEMCVGHSKRGMAKIYDQYRFQDEVRHALALWAARLSSIVAGPPAADNVVALGR